MSKLLGTGAFAHLFGLARSVEAPKEEEPPAPPAEPAARDPVEPVAAATDPAPPVVDAHSEQVDGEAVAASARAEERARCGAIFAAPAAAENVGLAAHLAFETDLTAEQAIGALGHGGRSGGGSGLANRMATINTPALGAGGVPKVDANSPEALAAGIIAAGNKARGRAA